MAETYFTPLPQSVGIEITSRCNLACRHCFNRSGEGSVAELPLAVLVDLFDQCRAMGLTGVRISGGEPTLHRDFPAVAAAASKRGLAVTLNTNGCFRSETRDRISTLPIASFLVSLDGLEASNDRIRGRGAFAQATETAALVARHRPRRDPGRPSEPPNLADVEGLIALAASLDAGIKFAPVRPIGRAADGMAGDILSPADFYRAVQTITRLWPAYPAIRITTDFDILQPATSPEPVFPARACCPAGRTMLNIGYDGYVYPCAFLITPEREFAAGHVSQAPLAVLWRESPVFTPFRTIEKDSQCQGCWAYGRSCVGGCLAMAYFAAGRLDAHDPTCFVDRIAAGGMRETQLDCLQAAPGKTRRLSAGPPTGGRYSTFATCLQPVDRSRRGWTHVSGLAPEGHCPAFRHSGRRGPALVADPCKIGAHLRARSRELAGYPAGG